MKIVEGKNTVLIYTALLFIIIAGLKFTSKIIIMMFLSYILASLLSPIVGFLKKLKVPKIVALLFTLIFVFVLFFLVFSILNSSIKDFGTNLPIYEQKLNTLIQKSNIFLSQYDISLDIKSITDGLNLNSFFQFTTKTAGHIGKFLSTLLLIMIGTFFILSEGDSFSKKFALIFKDDKDKLNAIENFSKTIKKYFVIKFFTSFLTGALIALVLAYYHIQYFILWGFLGFLLNFIPVIGSIIAAIPAILLSLISSPLETTLYLLLWYLLINNLISNVIEPMFMGDGLGLSPTVIFFSLIFWGWVFGHIGMFLAVILTISIKIAIDINPNLKGLSILLGKIKS